MLCLRKQSGEFWGPSDWDSAFTDKDMGSVFGQGTKILQGAQYRQWKTGGKKEKKMNHGFHESHAVPTSSTGKLKICDVKWELDHKKNWVPKNWCFQTVVLKKTLESPLDSKEIKSVNPKGNQPWIVIRRTDAEVEAPILWPPDMKNQLIGNDLDAGKDWGQKETGLTEEEMVGWHHQLNRHEFEQTPGNSEGQGNLACCSSWGSQRVRHNWVTEQHICPLNWSPSMDIGGYINYCLWRGKKIWWRESVTWTLSITKVIKMGTWKTEESTVEIEWWDDIYRASWSVKSKPDF